MNNLFSVNCSKIFFFSLIRYLDLKGMRRSGYYRFHCLASNVIHGVRHTKVMATKLRVIGEHDVSTSLSPITAGPQISDSSVPPAMSS